MSLMRVIVVGGSAGIGKAIVERLRKDECRVVSLSRRDGSLDLTWPEAQIRESVDVALENLGGLDRLVLSGGMGAYLSMLEMTDARVADLWQTNFAGPLQVYRASLRELIRSRGKVLWIGSTIATRGARGLSIYAATKGAVDAFVRSEARTLARHGIAMNVLSPGWIETEMTAEIKPVIRSAILKSIPMRRMGDPAEVAELARDILETPHFLTGSIIEMSGGA